MTEALGWPVGSEVCKVAREWDEVAAAVAAEKTKASEVSVKWRDWKRTGVLLLFDSILSASVAIEYGV